MSTGEVQLNMFEGSDVEAQEFENLLRSVNRKGVEEVLLQLKKIGFFEAPASTVFHLNRKGGLVSHSLSVYSVACKLREAMLVLKPELETSLPMDSLIIRLRKNGERTITISGNRLTHMALIIAIFLLVMAKKV